MNLRGLVGSEEILEIQQPGDRKPTVNPRGAFHEMRAALALEEANPLHELNGDPGIERKE
jgi:hypothetical protein